MKKALIILLTLLVFLQPFSKIWVFVSFKINQDYIAKNLCENRDKPTMHCNGKCQLMKKLKQADKEEQKQAPTTQKDKYEVQYCHFAKHYDFLNYAGIYLSKLNSAYENSFHTSSFITDIFRPPKLNLI